MKSYIILHTTFEKIRAEVESIEDARNIWNAYCKETGLRSSDMRGRCGDVVIDGNKVARVYYNGAVMY